ncbi:Rnh70p [Sugiyamaella lignohabitans]|uniref:Rnh70p n=1 Tax=Sugiyamaella lignohabitans TaxID=796027 RepID=A0A167DTS0_9ASCO|nr:Rnh70p [Sugiyamaella lignohabitans]ANB13282.1 Rnh70p [Sugiyamaella lignohabitans]
MLTTQDLRDLELYILSDASGPPAPKWISIRNKSFISHVVTLLIPGLEGPKFGITSTKDIQPIKLTPGSDKSGTFFGNYFSHVWPTKAPGTGDKLFSVVNTFMEVPFTKAEKKKQMNSDMEASYNSRKSGLRPEDLLLSLDRMVEEGYPMHPDIPGVSGVMNDKTVVRAAQPEDEIQSKQPDESPIKRPGTKPVPFIGEGNDWVETKQLHTGSPKVYAIDCEMCETRLGKELTRVTVLDNKGKIIIDQLVKPYEPIVDYLTRYSGITEELLADVTTRLSDVQDKLLSLISSTDIILGHSLESDLIALKMSHPKIIDTAIIFQHPKGTLWKPALRWLTSKYLDREIQTQGDQGHDSVEDAQACIDLLNVKLKNGRDFGLNKVRSVNLIKKLATGAPPKTTAIADYGVPHWHEEYAKTVVSCFSDDEIIANVAKFSHSHDFVWGRLRDLEKAKGWISDQERSTDEEIQAKYVELNDRLLKLYQQLPHNTALIIMGGSGDPREMVRLRKLKDQYQHEYKTKKWDQIECEWTSSQVMELSKATERARSGISFLTIKTADNEHGLIERPILTIGTKVSSSSFPSGVNDHETNGGRLKKSRSEIP